VHLGQSHEGRPLWALAIGRNLSDPDARPAVILNGAHHGGEILSIDVVLDAIAVLLTRGSLLASPGPGSGQALAARVDRFLDGFVIWCVPMVNPDGVWAALNDGRRSDRKNSRDNNHDGRIGAADGVDLNRNYPYRWGSLGEKGSSSHPSNEYYRGPAPASEPEVQAMIQLAQSEHPVASVSYHTGTVAVLAPYTIDGAQSPTPDEAWLVAEELTARLPRHPQDRAFVTRRKLYPVDGTDQDYLRHELSTLALLVESARRPAASTAERLAIVAAVQKTWMLLLDRYLDGPSLGGRVTSASGQPVVARVSIDEIKTHEQEQWSTRCRDGRFDRYLPGPGTYTVRAEVPGQAPLVRSVTVEKGRVEIELRLAVDLPAASCPAAPGAAEAVSAARTGR
jgi:hypothetical protein